MHKEDMPLVTRSLMSAMTLNLLDTSLSYVGDRNVYAVSIRDRPYIFLCNSL